MNLITLGGPGDIVVVHPAAMRIEVYDRVLHGHEKPVTPAFIRLNRFDPLRTVTGAQACITEIAGHFGEHLTDKEMAHTERALQDNEA